MRTWLRDTAGGLPATYWYLWTGLLINRTGAFAMLFLSLYLTDVRGARAAVAGLVVGAYGIGGAAGVLLGGVLADSWGRRRTLFWSHLVAGLLMIAMAFAGGIGTIAVLATLVGIVHSMPGPAFVAAIVDIVPEERRSRAFNLQFWAFNLGMAAASLLAGVLAGASFTALFLVDAAATLTTAAIILWKVPETLTGRRTRRARGGPGLRTALTDRAFLVFVALTFALAVLVTQTSTIMPLAMRADGLGPGAYGLVVAVGGALIVVGQLFVPRLIDGRRKHHVLALSTGLLAVGFGSLAFADHLAAYLAAAFVWTVGQMLAAPPNAEINAELAPPALRGRYQAVFYLTFPAASFVAPALGGASLEYLGDWHWIITGVAGLLAVGGHLLAGPPRERQVAARLARSGGPATGKPTAAPAAARGA
ncbi:MFS transporter [Polymorphospora lycopeni]|uniref:MFS transporter n=1 Tax=Polymorphospora lycopeni TaxID=3140240 RepID=A0ABV5CM97_9ACTN